MTDRKLLTQRVAAKALLASKASSLGSILQVGSSQARVALAQLRDYVDTAKALADKSDHKEAIYAEVGDLLVGLVEVMDNLEEGVSIIAYTSARLEQKDLKAGLPKALRQRIDDSIKKDV